MQGSCMCFGFWSLAMQSTRQLQHTALAPPSSAHTLLTETREGSWPGLQWQLNFSKLLLPQGDKTNEPQ